MIINMDFQKWEKSSFENQESYSYRTEIEVLPEGLFAHYTEVVLYINTETNKLAYGVHFIRCFDEFVGTNGEKFPANLEESLNGWNWIGHDNWDSSLSSNVLFDSLEEATAYQKEKYPKMEDSIKETVLMFLCHKVTKSGAEDSYDLWIKQK